VLCSSCVAAARSVLHPAFVFGALAQYERIHDGRPSPTTPLRNARTHKDVQQGGLQGVLVRMQVCAAAAAVPAAAPAALPACFEWDRQIKGREGKRTEPLAISASVIRHEHAHAFRRGRGGETTSERAAAAASAEKGDMWSNSLVGVAHEPRQTQGARLLNGEHAVLYAPASGSRRQSGSAAPCAANARARRAPDDSCICCEGERRAVAVPRTRAARCVAGECTNR